MLFKETIPDASVLGQDPRGVNVCVHVFICMCVYLGVYLCFQHYTSSCEV